MIHKSILTTLDAVVDHGFKSTIIPTFEIEELQHNQKLHKSPNAHSSLEILLSTLYNYIEENRDDMNSKEIIICVNNEEAKRIHSIKIKDYKIDFKEEKDLDNSRGNYEKEESKDDPTYNKSQAMGSHSSRADDSQLLTRINQLEREVEEITEEKKTHEDKSKKRKNRIDELRAQIEKLEKEIEDYKSSTQMLQNEVEKLTKENTRLENMNKQSHGNIQSYSKNKSEEKTKLLEEIQRLREECDCFKTSLGDQQTALQKFNLKDLESKQEIEGLKENIAQLNSQIKDLEEEKEEILLKISQDAQNYDDSMKELEKLNQELLQKLETSKYKNEKLQNE